MHLEVLNLETKKVFTKLRNFPEFYLAGGTALALQIGHRISIDFDLFSEKEISKTLLSKIRKIFQGYKIDIRVNHSEELTIYLNEHKVTFVRYPYPIILNIVDLEGIKILSALEIAASKAYVLGRRASYKDYVDLYFILRDKCCSLEDIIKIAQKKYKDEFDPRLFLEQLIYLEDIRDLDIQFIKKPVTKNQIREFFEQEIRKIKLVG